MNFSEFFQTGMSGVFTAAVTGFFTVNVLFFQWLMNSFSKLRDVIEKQEEDMRNWLNDHENKDQGRHDENLRRFEKIAVSLARLGSPNGQH